MHKNGNSSANYSTQKVDGRKMNKCDRSNNGMEDGFLFIHIFCKINKINTRGAIAIGYHRV